MSRALRNKQGCWTCRLRKKKCDEGHPDCATCRSLSITCHGYGAKPDWMNGGEQEREVLNNLKETVKHTSRRKAKPDSSLRNTHIVKIAPRSTNGEGEARVADAGPNLDVEHNVGSSSASTSSQRNGTSVPEEEEKSRVNIPDVNLKDTFLQRLGSLATNEK
jgi:C6 transcription factor Pro1